jgi:hypothetical protein
MKLYISGLPEQADADRLREKMSEFGPVEDVHVLREYMGNDPVWVVVMNVDPGTASEIAQRIDNIWYQGRFIRARVPLYPD